MFLYYNLEYINEKNSEKESEIQEKSGLDDNN